MHSVQKLYQYRKSLSTKPFNARGKKVIRCGQCQVARENCICELKPQASSNAAFLLLMYDTEVLKPSNTGRLIADLFIDTYAFLWSRTEVDEKLLALLQHEQWQPVIVFPKDYVDPEHTCHVNALPENISLASTRTLNGKRPLFILLDGSWREAKKMFRKSTYLKNIPVLSIEPSTQEKAKPSGYIRQAANDNQLATAQVAAQVLALYGEMDNAALLSLWFDVFNYQYQKSVRQPNTGNAEAIEQLANFLMRKQ